MGWISRTSRIGRIKRIIRIRKIRSNGLYGLRSNRRWSGFVGLGTTAGARLGSPFSATLRCPCARRHPAAARACHPPRCPGARRHRRRRATGGHRDGPRRESRVVRSGRPGESRHVEKQKPFVNFHFSRSLSRARPSLILRLFRLPLLLTSPFSLVPLVSRRERDSSPSKWVIKQSKAR